jgi:hypothetical protein
MNPKQTRGIYFKRAVFITKSGSTAREKPQEAHIIISKTLLVLIVLSLEIYDICNNGQSINMYIDDSWSTKTKCLIEEESKNEC